MNDSVDFSKILTVMTLLRVLLVISCTCAYNRNVVGGTNTIRLARFSFFLL